MDRRHFVLLVVFALSSSTFSKRPLIITTDADIDDIMALTYWVHTDAFEILAIVVEGNGWNNIIPGASDIATAMALAGCPSIPIAYGLELSTLNLGNISTGLSHLINRYFWGCLGVQPVNAVEASVYEGPRLITNLLGTSKDPVDIAVLGTFTNLAAALQLDPRAVDHVGTVWISSGKFNYTGPMEEQHWPFTHLNKGTDWNVFLDPLAFHRVLKSGIKNFTLMPSATQRMLPLISVDNIRTVDALKANISPDDFFLRTANNFASCLGVPESALAWWDPSLAVLAVDLTLGRNTFCTSFATVTVSVDLQGSGRFGMVYPDPVHGVPVKMCLAADYYMFLHKYWSALYTRPAGCPPMNQYNRLAMFPGSALLANVAGSQAMWSNGFMIVSGCLLGILLISQVLLWRAIRRQRHSTEEYATPMVVEQV